MSRLAYIAPATPWRARRVAPGPSSSCAHDVRGRRARAGAGAVARRRPRAGRPRWPAGVRGAVLAALLAGRDVAVASRRAARARLGWLRTAGGRAALGARFVSLQVVKMMAAPRARARAARGALGRAGRGRVRAEGLTGCARARARARARSRSLRRPFSPPAPRRPAATARGACRGRAPARSARACTRSTSP